MTVRHRQITLNFPFMSIRLYIGNLPQSFNDQELDALLKGAGEGIRFKPVLDRDTGSCRGFGFANVDDPKVADAIIEQLNGKISVETPFALNALNVVTTTPATGAWWPGAGNNQSQAARKASNKVVHSDGPAPEAPDPRWAGELSKLKDLLANQTTPV